MSERSHSLSLSLALSRSFVLKNIFRQRNSLFPAANIFIFSLSLVAYYDDDDDDDGDGKEEEEKNQCKYHYFKDTKCLKVTGRLNNRRKRRKKKRLSQWNIIIKKAICE